MQRISFDSILCFKQDLEQEASKLGLLDYTESCANEAGKNEVHRCKGTKIMFEFLHYVKLFGGGDDH